MFEFKFSFFNQKNLYPFDKRFRNGYAKSWINDIKNYTP